MATMRTYLLYSEDGSELQMLLHSKDDEAVIAACEMMGVSRLVCLARFHPATESYIEALIDANQYKLAASMSRQLAVSIEKVRDFKPSC